MGKKSELKIITFYHNRAKLIKDDHYLPIHVGRAISNKKNKDGKISNKELEWLKKNMIGDDTGENISYLNNKLCELTGIYWAWKNYEKIGNPDYIGFQQYRRILTPYKIKIKRSSFDLAIINKLYKDYEKLLKLCQKFNIINLQKTYTLRTNQESFEEIAGYKEADLTSKILKENFPEYYDSLNKYMKGRKLHCYNMFIMEKNLFFEYCEFVFKILFRLEKELNIDYENPERNRYPAYIAERLTDIFISKKMNDGVCVGETGAIFAKPPENFLEKIYGLIPFSDLIVFSIYNFLNILTFRRFEKIHRTFRKHIANK